MTVWHMRDLVSGEKRLIMQNQVKHIVVPNYEGLTIEKMLDFAKDYPNVMMALPIEAEIHKLNRGYLANVIHTIVGEPFA